MNMNQITPRFYAAPQIDPTDMAAIAEAGITLILCNRPDGEEPWQPGFKDVAQSAEAEGIEARSVPIISGQLTEADTEAFRAAFEALPKPILAYCRSGTRCTMMWSLTHIDTLGGDAILRAAAGAGYDMSGLVAQLDRRT
jgi:sulfide:quinone oxidoreductase